MCCLIGLEPRSGIDAMSQICLKDMSRFPANGFAYDWRRLYLDSTPPAT